MHEETATGLPGLMTGRYFGSEDERGKYGMSVFGKDSLLSPYVMSSNAVYFSGGLHSFGYTNRLKQFYTPTNRVVVSNCDSVFSRPSTSVPYLCMADAMAIRLTPYLLKNRCVNKAMKVAAKYRPKVPSVCRESQVRDIFRASSLSSEGMTLTVVHTTGLHWPISFDRNGNALPEPMTVTKTGPMVSYDKYHEAMRQAGYYVMSQVGLTLDDLRAKGIYNRTSIIIATDHGCIVMKNGKNNGSELGILWIKPEGDVAPFSYSDAPTSNAKIHDLVCALKDAPLTRTQMTSILSLKERLFRGDYHGVTLRSLGGRLHYKDWIYDESAELKSIRQF